MCVGAKEFDEKKRIKINAHFLIFLKVVYC